MDVSGWLVGLGIAAIAAAAGAWAWLRQRRLVAELSRRLEASEHLRLDLQAHAHQVDGQLATLAETLARQQAAMAAARVLPAAAGAAATPVQALLRHLGDRAPVSSDGSASDWLDTEPSTAADDALHEDPHPAFAETMPAELASLPDR